MSDQEKTVTCMSIRGAYDALSDILGDNARAIVLRGAGLARINDNPPPYTWDREFTNKQQLDIFHETIRLVGAIGAQGIIRQIGYKGVQAAVERFGILDSIKELPPKERFAAAVESLRSALNRGTVVQGTEGLVALDVDDCLFCSGTTSKKPYCSHYAGCIQMMADWVFGKGKYRVRETRCKAMGDETCLFELEAR